MDSLKYAYYLIVDKHADITGSYPRLVSFGNQMSKEECYPVELLRGWIFDIDSEKYKIKMEIVDEFMRQGVDYWNSEIPMHDLQTIVDMYPDTWREYIKQY